MALESMPLAMGYLKAAVNADEELLQSPIFSQGHGMCR
jgi:hypothetical protein